MKIKATNSTSYVCTLDLTCSADRAILEGIRASTRKFNSNLIPGNRPCQVQVKPIKQINHLGRDGHSNLKGGINNAQYADVYIYVR